jgi:ribosomal protein S18 acetylase RimI-like enzyme
MSFGANRAVGALEGVVVRRLLMSDEQSFRFVRLAALEDAPSAFGETWAGASAADWRARTADGALLGDRAVFLALSQERPIGMIFVRCSPPPAPAFLGGMWVAPAARRHGVGRSLVLAGVAFLKSAGQRRVALGVTSGHEDVLVFYRGLGFTETGATFPLRPGSDLMVRELVMELADQ